MPVLRLSRLIGGLLVLLTAACVDQLDLGLRGTVDVMVVDGTITNLPEPQLIRLSRSRADPITGRFAVLPITKATVEIVIDSAQVIPCHEAVEGTYQLPSDFRGQAGHAYQLQFTLNDGTRYVSNQQIMPSPLPIHGLSTRFNPTSLPPGLYPANFRAGYDLLLTTQDPPAQRNYYRWDWRLYEKQKWCKTCFQGEYVDSLQYGYLQNGTYLFTRQAVEACQEPFVKPNTDFWNVYSCRTPCWEIISNYTLNLFDDQLTNGGSVNGRTVGQVPLLTRQAALLELRQSSLTPDAYGFYIRLRQQTQNTGGLADTPPSAPVGNVRNPVNSRESVVGFFTASAVTSRGQWLDKKDATQLPLGAYDEKGKINEFDDELYYALIGRVPTPGPSGRPFSGGGPERYITAPCVASDSRTPIKPAGWRE